MSAVSVDVAEGVLAMLQAADLGQAIEPVRSDADWEIELEDQDSLHVDVVAVTTKQRVQLGTRGSLTYTIPIDIAVRKRFGSESQDDKTGRIPNDKKDPLKLLVQQIFELFIPKRLTEFTSGAWEDTEILVCPVREQLRQMRQFTGIVRVTFTVDKAIT